HAKIYLMSAIKSQNGIKGLITLMPYDFLFGHPEYSESHKSNWEESKNLLIDGIYKAKNFKGKYLLKL
ncbi:MAG: hypothetical protein ACK4Q5_21735, partial [Saprospiraceae bacterium]